jgi:hypothetical protein
VADRLGAVAFLLDVEGETELVLGSRGHGPGEFQRPDQTGFQGDSLLWISDSGPGRITWLRLDGSVASTTSRPREPIQRTPWMSWGRWALTGGRALGVGDAPQESPDHPRPVVVWDPEGDMTVVRYVEGGGPTSRRIQMRTGPFMTLDQPGILRGDPIVGVLPSGTSFFILDRAPAGASGTGSIRIERYTASGDLIGEIDIPYDPIPVGEEVRAWLVRQAEGYAPQLPPELGVSSAAIVEATWVPETLPPVQAALVDEDGFWLAREYGRGGPDRTRWERYDLRGTPRLYAELPRGFFGLAGAKDRILGWEVDSLGTFTVCEYQVGGGTQPEGLPPVD